MKADVESNTKHTGKASKQNCFASYISPVKNNGKSKCGEENKLAS